jgi:hypothetical protein
MMTLTATPYEIYCEIEDAIFEILRDSDEGISLEEAQAIATPYGVEITAHDLVGLVMSFDETC